MHGGRHNLLHDIVESLLLERQFIRVLGRKEIPGRPLIYATTKRFLEVFDLKDLKDLPTPKEIEEFGSTLAEELSETGNEEGAEEIADENTDETKASSVTPTSETPNEDGTSSIAIEESSPDQNA